MFITPCTQLCSYIGQANNNVNAQIFFFSRIKKKKELLNIDKKYFKTFFQDFNMIYFEIIWTMKFQLQ